MQNRINTRELLNYCRTFFRAADLSASLSALRLRRSCGVAAMLTVAPESPALGVVRPAASTVTAALRTHSKGQGGTWGGGAEETRLGRDLPGCYHTCTRPACARYEDTSKEQKTAQVSFPIFFFLFFSSFVSYLAGVSGAGFWDVAVVHGVPTHHAPQLVLQTDNISHQSSRWEC